MVDVEPRRGAGFERGGATTTTPSLCSLSSLTTPQLSLITWSLSEHDRRAPQGRPRTCDRRCLLQDRQGKAGGYGRPWEQMRARGREAMVARGGRRWQQRRENTPPPRPVMAGLPLPNPPAHTRKLPTEHFAIDSHASACARSAAPKQQGKPEEQKAKIPRARAPAVGQNNGGRRRLGRGGTGRQRPVRRRQARGARAAGRAQVRVCVSERRRGVEETRGGWGAKEDKRRRISAHRNSDGAPALKTTTGSPSP